MISFLSGLPGAGKSLFAMQQICHELQHTERHVCTNLPIRRDALIEWLIKNTGSADAIRRLRILTDDECMQFWLHYGVGYDVQGRVEIKSGERKMSVPDLGARNRDGNKFPGTFFVIDELHVFFPSRNWAKTGEDALYYQSQHRGLGDDCLLMSQHPEQCDKAMRRLCQDFTYLQNLGKTKILGFTFPGIGRRATYAKEDAPEPLETGTYRLAISEYGPLYDTNAKAGGIVGRTDIKEKGGGGMSPWLIPFAIAGVLAACWILPNLVMKGISAFTSKAVGGMSQMAIQVSTNAVKFPTASGSPTNHPPFVTNPPPAIPSTPPAVLPVSAPAVAPVPVSASKPVTIMRRQIVGPARQYWLSDGTIVRQGDGNVVMAAEDYIILQGGKVIWLETDSDARRRFASKDYAKSEK